jgi:hypothetical protein
MIMTISLLLYLRKRLRDFPFAAKVFDLPGYYNVFVIFSFRREVHFDGKYDMDLPGDPFPFTTTFS